MPREKWLKLVEQQVELHRQVMTEEFNTNAAEVAKRKMEIAAEVVNEHTQAQKKLSRRPLLAVKVINS